MNDSTSLKSFLIESEKTFKKNTEEEISRFLCLKWLKSNCSCNQCLDEMNDSPEFDKKTDKILQKCISKKISSYKQQDIRKKRFEKEKIINVNQCIKKLLHSTDKPLSCKYCTNEVKLHYSYLRDSEQWTLDRINNDIGHFQDNLVISCLKCNLQKRRIQDEKFTFQKQFTLEKIE